MLKGYADLSFFSLLILVSNKNKLMVSLSKLSVAVVDAGEFVKML